MKAIRFVLVLPFVVLHFVLCITAGLLTSFTNRATKFVGQTIYFIGADSHRLGGISAGSVSRPMWRVFNFVNGVANTVSGHPWRTVITIMMVYCEAQGPGKHGEADHVKHDPGGEESGTCDEHQGRRLWKGNEEVKCEMCGAPVRRRLVKT